MGNWYSTGLIGQTKFKEMEALRQITSKQNNVRRFKLKPGEKAKIIFLEHPYVWMYEHSVNVDGRWENFTCTSDTETCPLCIMKNKQSTILVTTVIDTRKSVSGKTGKEYQYQKSLLVVKGKAIRAMLRQFLEGTKMDLTHYIVEVERDSDKQSVACGEFFTLGNKVSVPKLEALAQKQGIDPKEYLKPYDYLTVLAPKSDKDLRTISGMGDPMGSEESSDLEDDDGLGIDLEDTPAAEEDMSDLDLGTSEDDTPPIEGELEEEENILPFKDSKKDKKKKKEVDAIDELM